MSKARKGARNRQSIARPRPRLDTNCARCILNCLASLFLKNCSQRSSPFNKRKTPQQGSMSCCGKRLNKSVQALRRDDVASAGFFAATTSPTLRVSAPRAADALARSTGTGTILLTGTGQR